MKKILIAVLFSSFIFLIPNSITANKTDTKIEMEKNNTLSDASLLNDNVDKRLHTYKILDKQILIKKLEEHQKLRIIEEIKKHNAISITSVLTDSEGNVLSTYTIYKDDNRIIKH